jgi:ATP-binding cassette subfamily B multidrug efflux pump
MRELRALLPYLRSHRTALGLGLILVVVSNIFGTIAPLFVQRAIDALAAGAPFATVRTAVLLLLGTAVLGGIARYGMRDLLNSASRRVEYDLRNRLYAYLQELSAEFYDRYATGDVMARTTNDLLAVRMVAGPALMYLVDTVVRAILVIPIMVHVSPPLALVTLAPLLVLPLVMVAFGSVIHRRSEAIQAQFSALTSHAHEVLSGVRIVRAYRQEAAELRHFQDLNEEYSRRNFSLARAQGMFHPLLAFLGGLGTVALFYAGGRLVVAGTVTVGEFVAFGVYLASLVWPMIALGWVVSLVQRGAASMGRINEILEQRPAVESPAAPAALPPPRGGRAVAFEGVWFRYPDARERGWVLEDVSFEIPAGAALAIVGATGSGKSSLVDLLVRTYDPERGRILLDGIDIRELSLEELRGTVGFVPQETFLFSATVRENILLGAPDDGRLERAAETAQFAEALPALPDGYDTLLGERGINLSGGQKQRAAIARAIAKNPPVFVLDDALSAVDAQTEARILRALRGALSGRTSITVSHRLAAVRAADLILVIESGRIVERGTHERLLAAGGRYWELLRRQQIEEEIEKAEPAAAVPPA